MEKIEKVLDCDEIVQCYCLQQATGVGRLLYESVRGVQKQTNSAAEKVCYSLCIFSILGIFFFWENPEWCLHELNEEIQNRYVVNVILFCVKIIQAAIGCLSSDSLPLEYVHESLRTLWNALAEYLAPEYTSVLWGILFVRIFVTYASGSMIKYR